MFIIITSLTSLTIIFYQNTYELKGTRLFFSILFFSILLSMLCHSVVGAMLETINTQICVSKLYFMNMCAEIEILND